MSISTKSLSTMSYIEAVLLGALISALLSSGLVIAGLRAGITPGVSPLIVLLAWVVCGALRKPVSTPYTLILQTTGSAGAAVTAGVIFTAPILQLAAPEGVAPAVRLPLLVIASSAGALLGWSCVGFGSRRMVYDRRLPAPEAVACNEILNVATAPNTTRETTSDRQRPSLWGALIAPSIVTLMSTLGIALGYLRDTLGVVRIYSASIPIPLSPLYFGIGAILSLETAIVLAVGGFGHATIRAVSATYHLDPDTFRWVGAAAMTVAIVYALCSYIVTQWSEYRRGLRSLDSDANISGPQPLPEPLYWALLFAMVLGILMAILPNLGDVTELSTTEIGKTLLLGGIFVLVAVALSAIGALLSLQVGSSASPVSATVFVGMLVLSICCTSLYANTPLETMVYLLVALCVAICAANDSSQDYRTLVLQDYPIYFGYFPQLVGLLAAVCIVPPTLWLAHDAFYLGSEALPAPQASFFSVVLLSLLNKGIAPSGAIGCGIAVGLIAILIERVGLRCGRHLSAVSFCVGLYLPPVIGVGILMGALMRYYGSRARQGASSSGSSGLLAGASCISIDAAASLGFATANILGYVALTPEGTDGLSLWLSWLFASLLLAILYRQFRSKKQ